MNREIAFLALSQAHQFLHWLPAALRLAKEPGVRVTVLVSTESGEEFIRSYDPGKTLRIERLRVPGLRNPGLFDPPSRLIVLLLNARKIGNYPTIVTTETTSSMLLKLPGFRSGMVHLKHGAGDREGGYNPKHAHFHLTLVNGTKDKQRLIDRGLGTDENFQGVGYAKFELAPTTTEALFDDDKPIALFNPHFDKKVSSWQRNGREIVAAMGEIEDWNFVVAPHVKSRGGPVIPSTKPNVLIDHGSVRSIDMTYTRQADVYIGDASSQVYEFIRTPRPCIFLNLEDRAWKDDPAYSHWELGQVITDLRELPAALARTKDVQPRFVEQQRKMLAVSIDESDVPASIRQAQAILEFAYRRRAIA